MPAAGIAFGSNLGDRLAHLRQARDLLAAHPAVEILAQAPVFRTSPVHCPDGSPDFFNSAIEIRCTLDPEALLDLTQGIQLQLRRDPRAGRNAPRTIDLDLLYFGTQVTATARLELPHPRLAERRFVLEPLAAIRPDLVLPGQQQTIAGLLDGLQSDEPPLVIETADW